MVSDPPGVMVRAAALVSSGVVTLVLKVGLLDMVMLPRALSLRLPLALTARVPPGIRYSDVVTAS